MRFRTCSEDKITFLMCIYMAFIVQYLNDCNAHLFAENSYKLKGCGIEVHRDLGLKYRLTCETQVKHVGMDFSE